MSPSNVHSDPNSLSDHILFARSVLAAERRAIELVSDRLDNSFVRAAVMVSAVAEQGGAVMVTGMGKAGLVGQKVAATLASTGTRSHWLHPADAMHGDLGRIARGDVVLAFSFSGETEEVVRILGPIRSLGGNLIAVTARADSRLARQSDSAIVLGPIEEACPLRLAPSASTTAMMAIGDALAFTVSRIRNFRPEHFAEYHPGGNLGRLTSPVDELMRTGPQLRVAHYHCTLREALIDTHMEGRRTGALLVVDDDRRLCGIFTDADLARLLARRGEADLDRPVASLMNTNPTVIATGTLIRDAIAILSGRKFSQLPVLDNAGRPIGIIDITDLIGIVPVSQAAAPDAEASSERMAA